MKAWILFALVLVSLVVITACSGAHLQLPTQAETGLVGE